MADISTPTPGADPSEAHETPEHIASAVTALDERLFRQHLEEDEKIVGVIHQHWLSFFQEAFLPTAGGILLPILAIYLFRNATVTIALLIIVIATAGYVLFLFLDWFHDAIVLTTQNVILIMWKNPFSMKTHRIEYGHIESVDVTRSGLMSFLLSLGKLEMVTPNGAHVLPLVHAPEEKQQWILERKHEMTATEAPDIEVLRQALESLLADRGAPGYAPPPAEGVVNDMPPPKPRKLHLSDLSPSDE